MEFNKKLLKKKLFRKEGLENTHSMGESSLSEPKLNRIKLDDTGEGYRMNMGEAMKKRAELGDSMEMFNKMKSMEGKSFSAKPFKKKAKQKATEYLNLLNRMKR